MPYYIYKVYSKKSLDLITEFDSFKDAKNFVSEHRTSQKPEDDYTVKITFAENSEQAEKDLTTVRETPILMEHEK